MGDFIAFDPRSQFLDNGFIKSRHLDDKAGSACMLATLKAVQEIPQHRPVVLFLILDDLRRGRTWCSGGDRRSRGRDSSRRYRFSRGRADLQRNGSHDLRQRRFSPTIIQLTNALVRIAENQEIPHRLDVFPHYGSDASIALRAGHDLRAGLIGPGVFATHFYERTHQEGLQHTSELLLAYLADIPDKPG